MQLLCIKILKMFLWTFFTTVATFICAFLHLCMYTAMYFRAAAKLFWHACGWMHTPTCIAAPGPMLALLIQVCRSSLEHWGVYFIWPVAAMLSMKTRLQQFGPGRNAFSRNDCFQHVWAFGCLSYSKNHVHHIHHDGYVEPCTANMYIFGHATCTILLQALAAVCFSQSTSLSSVCICHQWSHIPCMYIICCAPFVVSIHCTPYLASAHCVPHIVYHNCTLHTAYCVEHIYCMWCTHCILHDPPPLLLIGAWNASPWPTLPMANTFNLQLVDMHCASTTMEQVTLYRSLVTNNISLLAIGL